MRSIAHLGLGLFVAGALLLAASSGAFDSTVAERGMQVEVASDADALLGLEYPNEERVLELESDDASGDSWCFLGNCGEYEYDGEAVVHLEDNLPDGSLSVESLVAEADEDDIVGGDELGHEPTPDGLRVVLGDFRCPASGSGFFSRGEQESRSATVTVDVEVGDGPLTIELEREVAVECVPD